MVSMTFKFNIFRHLYSLPDIMEEIAKEDEEKHRRHMRRAVARQERLKSAPPRLGKHKYETYSCSILLDFTSPSFLNTAMREHAVIREHTVM